MKVYQLKLLIIVALSIFIIQSCSDDSELLGVENAELRGGRGGGGNGGGGNGNNENLSNLDSEVLENWNHLLCEIDQYATGMRPNSTARSIAYIYLASFETAVPAMRNFHSNEKILQGLKIDQREKARNINYELALNKALSVSIDHFIINLPSAYRAKISELEQSEYSRISQAQNVSNRVVEDSNEWGEYVANQIIKYAQTDDSAEEQILDPQPISYVPPTGDGYWTFSAEPERALFPYWGNVRTFAIDPNETTTVEPVAYSEDPNSNYYQQMMDVVVSNNTAREQDNEDLWIAEFWSDDVEGLMFSPPMRQVSIANQLIAQNDEDLETSLHLMLKLGFSLNDAAVATWKYKYQYMVMRPSVYIQNYIDPTYQTNLFSLIPWPNPTFPGYPSGHSCFASAAGGVFIDFYGNEMTFTDRSHEGRTEFRGMPRTFSSIEEMAAENAFSRIPLGVHIEMDCSEGLRLGYEIADAVNDYSVRQ